MSKVKFNQFIPGKKKRLLYVPLIYGNLVLHLIITFLSLKYFPDSWLLDYSGFMVLASFCVAIPVGIFLNFRREPLNGQLISSLEFKKDKIITAEKNYDLEDITKIEFKLYDYDYMWEYSHFSVLEPKRLNGTKNTLHIHLKNGITVEILFQRIRENDILEIKEELIHYYRMNKTHWLHLIELLKIDDYDEILKFKKKLTTANKTYTQCG